MDFFMGLKGKDFVVVCSDTVAAQSIIRMKADEDKIVKIDEHKVFALSGEPGDRVQFTELMIANIRLYALSNEQTLSTHAVANFTRQQLATALRKNPYNTNLLLAGYDEKTGPSLYFIDYLGTMHSMNLAGTGYGQNFVLSLFDRLWHKDLTEEEAVKLMELGIEEVQKRLVVAQPSHIIKVVDKNGVRTIKTVVTSSSELPPATPQSEGIMVQ